MESTDKDVYMEREKVLIWVPATGSVECKHYDTVPVGSYYMVRLRTGRYSLYKKTSYFDDDLLYTYRNMEEGIDTLRSGSSQKLEI